MNRKMRDLGDDLDRFVSPTTYKPSDQYFKVAANLLPKSWRLKQDYHWTHAIAPFGSHPVQGWKIHISAVQSNAIHILEIVIPICIKNEVEFKFNSDPSILHRSLSKLAARSASGKFVTIYPKNKQCFLSLLEDLYVALKDEAGPYILSDKRYKDSKVLYYRYGGIQSFTEKNIYGKEVHSILDNEFNYISDVRGPSFVLPHFIEDIANVSCDNQDNAETDENDIFLFDGKYKIDSVIRFSNAGGVYNAFLDKTHILIKEVRPYIGIDNNGFDALDRLKREHRLLAKLANENIAPKSFGMFTEWEHTYLAMEFIDGEVLRKYIATNNKIIHASSTSEEIQEWFEIVKKISINVINAIDVLHSYNIVFGDISLNNIIVNPVTLNIKLIDFEASCELGIDAHVNMYTPGFGSTSRWSKECVEKIDDYFALGCLLTSMLLPITSIIDLKNDIIPMLLHDIKQEYALPEYFIAVVLDLLSDNPKPLFEHIKILSNTRTQTISSSNSTSTINTGASYSGTIQAIVGYILHSMNTNSRQLFPIAQEAVSSVAIDNGALGVMYALQNLSISIPDEALSWVFSHIERGDHTPGLLNGLSGMAWASLGLDRVEYAQKLLKNTQLHRHLYYSMSLGFGAAGYGLANLKMWHHTKDDIYLTESIKIGDILHDMQIETDNGVFWSDFGHDAKRIGYHYGSSGIALFLLYLYCATGQTRFLALGEKDWHLIYHTVACFTAHSASQGSPARMAYSTHI